MNLMQALSEHVKNQKVSDAELEALIGWMKSQVEKNNTNKATAAIYHALVELRVRRGLGM